MKNRLLHLATLVLIIVTYTSCDDLAEIGDIDDVAYEPEYALPLVNTQLTIAQFFEDENANSALDIDAEGNMVIKYNTEGPSVAFADVAEFPAMIPFQASESGSKLDMSLDGPFQPQKVKLKTGTVRFSLESDMTTDVEVRMMIPELLTNGEMFSEVTTMQPQGGQGMMTVAFGPMDISNYTFELTTENEVTIMYEATDANGNVTLNGATGQFENLSYEYIEGTWENEAMTLPTETIEIGLYNNWESGTLTFAEPKVRLDINTNVGFPSAFAFTALTGTTVDDQMTTLTGSIIGAQNVLTYPTLEEIEETKTSSILIDNSNSNINTFFNSELSKVDLGLSMQTNTGGNDAIGFITDDATLTSELFVELPVYGTATDFALKDEFEADLGDVENIKSAEITVNIVNGMPIELDLQLYFKNEAGEVFETLFVGSSTLIESAEVDGNGNVTQSTSTTIVQDLAELRANDIFSNTKTIEVEGTMSTVNNGGTPVRINANHGMDIQVSAIVNIKD